MKTQITYVSHHDGSINQMGALERSFVGYSGWEYESKSGITPRTLKKYPERNIPMIEQSRLLNFKRENINRYETKLSCVLNHVMFWRRVVEADEPMAFLEHDALCCGDWKDYDFDEYLILNAESVFRPPNKLAIQRLKGYKWTGKGVNNLPDDYPLQYHRENAWHGYNMAPGTGAYAITPKGAKRLLTVAEKNLDQSDFIVNSHNVNIQYIMPSVMKFQNVNLSLSYGIN